MSPSRFFTRCQFISRVLGTQRGSATLFPVGDGALDEPSRVHLVFRRKIREDEAAVFVGLCLKQPLAYGRVDRRSDVFGIDAREALSCARSSDFAVAPARGAAVRDLVVVASDMGAFLVGRFLQDMPATPQRATAGCSPQCAYAGLFLLFAAVYWIHSPSKCAVCYELNTNNDIWR